MLIRRARPEDIRSVMRLAIDAHNESAFQHLELDSSKLKSIALSAISERHGNFILLAASGSESLGIIHGIVGPYIISSSGNILSIQNLIVSRKARKTLASGRVVLKLLKSAITYGRSHGAHMVVVCSTSGTNSKATHRVCQKIGLRTVGGNYVGGI